MTRQQLGGKKRNLNLGFKQDDFRCNSFNKLKCLHICIFLGFRAAVMYHQCLVVLSRALKPWLLISSLLPIVVHSPPWQPYKQRVAGSSLGFLLLRKNQRHLLSWWDAKAYMHIWSFFTAGFII